MGKTIYYFMSPKTGEHVTKRSRRSVFLLRVLRCVRRAGPFALFARKQLTKPERQQKQREQLPQKPIIDELSAVSPYHRAEKTSERGLFYERFIHQVIFEVEYQRDECDRQKKQQVYPLRGSLRDVLEDGQPHHEYKSAAKPHRGEHSRKKTDYRAHENSILTAATVTMPPNIRLSHSALIFFRKIAPLIAPKTPHGTNLHAAL